MFEPPDRSVRALMAEFCPRAPGEDRPEGTPQGDWEIKVYNDRVKSFFENAAFLDRAYRDPSETLRQRVVIAWRITRMMARLRGFLAENDFLAEMPAECWNGPSPPSSELNVPSYYPAFNRILLTTALEKGYFGLIPPEDEAKKAFFELISGLGAYNTYRDGSPKDPLLGRLGYEPLKDPKIGPLAWPSPEQITAFEMLLVEEVLKELLQNQPNHVRHLLYAEFGLSSEDCVQLFRLARRQAIEMTRSDLEEDRAIAKMRAEDFIARARSYSSMQAEIAGLKHLAGLNGLLRFEPVEKERDIIDTIAKVAQERKQARIAAKEDA